MKNPSSLMQFPCDFPMKIIGKNHPRFQEDIMSIVHQHFPETAADAVRVQTSKNAKYLAVSVLLRVSEQSTLDALYIALTQHPDINMVL